MLIGNIDYNFNQKFKKNFNQKFNQNSIKNSRKISIKNSKNYGRKIRCTEKCNVDECNR